MLNYIQSTLAEPRSALTG